jgi:hypothetical protein
MSEETRNVKRYNTPAQQKMVDRIEEEYRSSYSHLQSEGWMDRWSEWEDAWAGERVEAQDENDPASNTNIIQPIIESQVADLCDDVRQIGAEGVEYSDQQYSWIAKKLLEWAVEQNDPFLKLDDGERMRLKLGGTPWKVWFDPDALDGFGLPKFEPINPAYWFPDPKVKSMYDIDNGDFIIVAKPTSLSYIRRRFGQRGKLVQARPTPTYDPQIYSSQHPAIGDPIARDMALLIERWTIEDDGKLRVMYTSEGIFLEDSFDKTTITVEDPQTGQLKEVPESFYAHRQYPFTYIPCYRQSGTLHGLSDVQLLLPVQDLINDLDDQIRMNARLMGNIQVVVGLASGINPKKWTNQPGLKIPARNHEAWKMVQPTAIPNYILTRRDSGFGEAELLSGRSDITEGRRAGSIRTASGIIAMQEAGARKVNHKKLMLEWGFGRILYQMLELMEEFYTEERAFYITGDTGEKEFMWTRPSDLNSTDRLRPMQTEGEDGPEVVWGPIEYVDEETGEVIRSTKKVQLNTKLTIGSGLPNNKAFQYQATTELVAAGILTIEEGRAALAKILPWYAIDPWEPRGNFGGRNLSPDQAAYMNTGMTPEQQAAMQGQMQEGQMANGGGQIPPELLNQLVGMLGGAPGATG